MYSLQFEMAYAAGIFNSKASGAAKGHREAVETQPGSDTSSRSHQRALLMFQMDGNGLPGGRVPAGDLRFVTDAREGLCQLVIVHCRQHASNDTVRLPIRNAYDTLQECVDR